MRLLTIICGSLSIGCASLQAAPPQPIIDMHLHAFPLSFAAGVPVCTGDQNWVMAPLDPKDEFDASIVAAGCAKPLRSPATDDALMRGTIALLARYNIRHAVTSGPPSQVALWRAAAPHFIVPAAGFATDDNLSVSQLRALHDSGRAAVFAEVSTQYRGLRADDPSYEPFWALAEQRDVPVGIHMGEGPPAAGRFPGYETYRAGLSSTFQLEAVLRRHPHLRVYAMHYGSPLVDDTIAMMYSYPNLYVDVAANDWQMRRPQFYDHLKRLIDAGFEKRIMFGSDQMLWPEAIGVAIDTIEKAPFLSEQQRRDIFYNNAARFLRLTQTEIAKDHRPQ